MQVEEPGKSDEEGNGALLIQLPGSSIPTNDSRVLDTSPRHLNLECRIKWMRRRRRSLRRTYLKYQPHVVSRWVGVGVGFAGKSGKRKPTKAFVGIGVGVGALIVKFNVWVPVPLPLVALRPTLVVPIEVGVPEINPVAAFTVRPAGRNGVAPQVVIV